MNSSWYSDSIQAPLYIDSLHVIVRMQDATKAELENLRFSFPRIVDFTGESTIDSFVVCSLSTGVGYWTFLDSLADYPTLELSEPYYVFPSGARQLVGGNICVGFDTLSSLAEIDSICSSRNVERGFAILGLDNVFVVHNTKQSRQRVVALANAFHALPQVLWAHPDFGVDVELTSCK